MSMLYKKLTLDPFQEDAIKAIEKDDSVVVSAPTGSGKTLIADYIIEKNKNNKKRIIYTAPIKALSNQKYKDFSREYGSDNIGLMTGDIVINPHAKVLIMTTEIYRNMAIAGDDELKDIVYVIFDEVHYINDIERGTVWEESIIYSKPSVRFLCLSATIPNATEFAAWISAIKKHKVATVVATKRNVPLDHQFFDYELGITTLKLIKQAKEIPQYEQVHRKKGQRVRTPEPNHLELIKQLGKGKLPCLFFSFSRRDCQNKARELAKANFFRPHKDCLTFFNAKLKEGPDEISRLPSTMILKKTISQGIAFHHAGLLPIVKEAVEELFSEGKINVLYTTETFAVGINYPAKTVCFAALRKYDGVAFRPLNTKEYFQIAGRAGRRGIDTQGHVVSMIYRPSFNYNEVKRITDKDIEPIKSQFKLSVNTTLNLIHQHSEEQIEFILRMSFFSYQKFGEEYEHVDSKRILARYHRIRKQLEKLGYVVGSDLTNKGRFASKVFADEITFGEIFATDIVQALDEYHILLILATLVYEPRMTHSFKQPYLSSHYQDVRKLVAGDPWLSRQKKFLNLKKVTTLVHPIQEGVDFFGVLKLTNLLEGDLIRFYSQILDRLGQIRKATYDSDILRKVSNCEGMLKQALEGVWMV